MKKANILTINHNPRNLELLARYLEQEGYHTCGISRLQELEGIVEGPKAYDLALLDISGFDRSVWEWCRRISDRGIALLVVSPRHSTAIQHEGLRHGAQSVMTKPLVIRELLALIEVLLKEA